MTIVANHPAMSGTLPDFLALSRKGPRWPSWRWLSRILPKSFQSHPQCSSINWTPTRVYTHEWEVPACTKPKLALKSPVQLWYVCSSKAESRSGQRASGPLGLSLPRELNEQSYAVVMTWELAKIMWNMYCGLIRSFLYPLQSLRVVIALKWQQFTSFIQFTIGCECGWV